MASRHVREGSRAGTTSALASSMRPSGEQMTTAAHETIYRCRRASRRSRFGGHLPASYTRWARTRGHHG
jgi:hypothetical protein